MSTENLHLFDYQEKASEFLQKIPRCILRLDTGLGKTAVCIDAARRIPGVNKVLVIAPAFLGANWIREIKMWNGLQKRNAERSKIEWQVVSYTKLSKIHHTEDLAEYKWDMVICDEAHYLKNPLAKRTKNIVENLLTRKKRVVLSTATPFVRSAADLYVLFKVCQPGKKWGKFRSFQEKYCLKKPNVWKRWERFDYYGANPKTVGELKREAKAFMISMKKKDVLKSLPEKLETDFVIEMKGKNKRHLLDNLDLEETIDVDTGKMSGGLKRILSKESIELGVMKTDYLMKFIETLDKEEPLVVFCKHKLVLREICNRLAKEGIEHAYIHGEVMQGKRDVTILDFQEGKYKVLVATMGSCGVGVTLTASSRCVFVELPWSYTELKQCEDRLHRIGAKSAVNVYRLIADGTIDDLIVGVLNRKIDGEQLSIGSM